MSLTIDDRLCPADHLCPLIMICPVEAISQSGFEALPKIDTAHCIDCGDCEGACPKQAVVRWNDDVN